MAIVKRDSSKTRPSRHEARAKPEEKLELSLPTEVTLPQKQLWRNLILLFGERKIGKSALMAAAGAFFLATEVGYKGLRVYKRDVSSWREALGYARLLRKDKTYRCVVVDTTDLLYDLALAYVCEKLVIAHPSEEDYGKAWHEIKKEFEKFILGLAMTGKGVVLISHAEEKEVKLRDGRTFDRIMPTMSNQARKVVEGMVDVWACFQYDGRRRVLTIAGDDHVSAGHRFGERFRAPDGRPLRHIYMGRSPEEGLANFEAAWENKFEPHRESDADEKKKSRVTLK